MDSAVIETAQMAAGDAEVNTANFDIGHLLGFDDGVTDILLAERWIADFTFTNAAGASLSQADNIQGAIRAEFSDDRAHL